VHTLALESIISSRLGSIISIAIVDGIFHRQSNQDTFKRFDELAIAKVRAALLESIIKTVGSGKDALFILVYFKKSL
jgi:hypothetical protein